jgi:hypothetical protein
MDYKELTDAELRLKLTGAAGSVAPGELHELRREHARRTEQRSLTVWVRQFLYDQIDGESLEQDFFRAGGDIVLDATSEDDNASIVGMNGTRYRVTLEPVD